MAKKDIYQEVTSKIVAVLETVDLADYQPPFAALAAQGLPLNPITEHRYQGINIPSLWFDQQDKGFSSSHWATFNQWKERGASVRKGEKGSPIIFYKTLVRQEQTDSGETEERAVPMLKTYTVFNADQVDGYDRADPVRRDDIDLVTRIQAADHFCASTGADIRHGGAKAFYHRVEDFIQIPDTRSFVETT